MSLTGILRSFVTHPLRNTSKFTSAVQLQPCRHGHREFTKNYVKEKYVEVAKLSCRDCYFAINHKTDLKYVLCPTNPEHKQVQNNGVEYRMKHGYYFWGMRDLGAPTMYSNCRLADIGYQNKTRKGVYHLTNTANWEGLRNLSEKATEIMSSGNPNASNRVSSTKMADRLLKLNEEQSNHHKQQLHEHDGQIPKDDN